MCSRTRSTSTATGSERLDVDDRVVALGHERVQVGEHLDHLAAADEAGEVEPVRADVGNGAQATLTRGVEAPVPVGVEEQPVLVVAAGDEARLTDRARSDQGGGVLVLRVVADVEAHGVDDAGGLGEGDELGGLRRRHAEWLLAHHVAAGGEHGAHVLGVDVVGAGDVDDLDCGDELVDASRTPAEAGCPTPPPSLAPARATSRRCRRRRGRAGAAPRCAPSP